AATSGRFPFAEMPPGGPTEPTDAFKSSGGTGTPGNQYNTKLTPEEETQFATWKEKYAPNDTGRDYDLRGAFKAGLTPDSKSGHWPDTFKKPSHPTFSNESMYHGTDGNIGGTWGRENDKDTFTPSETNLKNMPREELQD